MKYKLRHQTLYTYKNSVNNYQSILCLQPATNHNQVCENFSLEISPSPQTTYSRKDYWGNTQHYFSIHEPHTKFKVEASSVVEVFSQKLPDYSTITYAEWMERFKKNNLLKNELLQFLLPSQFIHWDEEIKAFVQPCFAPEKNLYECIKNLTHHIYSNFQFKSGFSSVNTPLKTILKEKKGVCQDFSHLAIASLRSMGIAARYVSGYIETLPPKGKPKLKGSDASHAWIAAYVPEMGWCEFDPTNNIIPQEKHIVTAYGRDYADVVPIKGIIFSSGEHKVDVEVDVIPLLF